MSADSYEFTLKKIAPTACDAAHERAQRYRLLNEPGEAESICRDILAIAPTHRAARITLLLAITDQFRRGIQGRFEEAKSLVEEIQPECEQAYYRGIICERRAKATYQLGGPGCGVAAYDWFRRAMEWFDQACAGDSADDGIAALRWNACARKIMTHPDIRPPHEEPATGVQSE